MMSPVLHTSLIFTAHFWWWIFTFWHYYYLLSVYLLQDAYAVSHSRQDIQQSWALRWLSSPPSWQHFQWCQLSWHHFTYFWWTFIFWHISPILQLLIPITNFLICMSLYCRMHGLSHTLGNTFSKAELCVDVHHHLADDVFPVTLTLLAYLT